MVLCTAGSLELLGAFPPGPAGGLIAPSPPPPDNQLLQAMKYGHCISCFRKDTTFVHALTTNLAHHSKFLKKGLTSSHKILTGIIAKYMRNHTVANDIWDEGQLGAAEGVLGMADQLIIDRCIMEEVKQYHRNLAVAF